MSTDRVKRTVFVERHNANTPTKPKHEANREVPLPGISAVTIAIDMWMVSPNPLLFRISNVEIIEVRVIHIYVRERRIEFLLNVTHDGGTVVLEDDESKWAA